MSPCAEPTHIQPIAVLTAADIPACVALSTEAGWNQNAADWQRIMTNGEAFGLHDEGLVASSAILPYGGFGWICMILVTRDAQRRGHAIRLMRNCLDRLERRGMVAGLDATPEGRTVYLRLGFQDVYQLSRLYAPGSAHDTNAGSLIAIETLSSSDLPQVLAEDRSAFGGDRSSLLAALQRELPGLAYIALRDRALVGYAFARPGRFATQIGPVVAETSDIARALVGATLGVLEGPAIIDVPDHQTEFYSWLLGRGFERQRGFTRMLRGRSEPFEKPRLTMAIAGPELG